MSDLKEIIEQAPEWQQALKAHIAEGLRNSEHVTVYWEDVRRAFPRGTWNSFDEATADLNACRDWARSFGWWAEHGPETESEPHRPVRFSILRR